MSVNWDSANYGWELSKRPDFRNGVKARQEAPGKTLGPVSDNNVCKDNGRNKQFVSIGSVYANWAQIRRNVQTATIKQVDPNKITENKNSIPVAVNSEPKIKETR